MSTGFEFPIFLRTRDSGEVKAYSSVIDMELDLEEIDVENGEYEAWDAGGIPLALSVQREKIWLRLAVAAAPQPEQLILAIAERARRAGWISTLPLCRRRIRQARSNARERWQRRGAAPNPGGGD